MGVQAIAPNAGEGDDQVKKNDPADDFRVPVERILLRYTAALREKQLKLEKENPARDSSHDGSVHRWNQW